MIVPPALPGLRAGRAAYPQLALGEKVVSEATLGRDLALLTDRRLVVAGGAFENSFALGQIGLVRSAFRRSPRDIVVGTLLVLLGVLLLAVAAPLKTALAAQIASFQAAGADSAGAALTASLLRGARHVAGFLPSAGLLVGALGVARAVVGVLGETTISVHAGGGELQYTRRGRDRALEAFVREVAKALPLPQRWPARGVAPAPTEAGATEPVR